MRQFRPKSAQGGRERQPVLPRARFSDDRFLAQMLGEKNFPDTVVDLVRARVVEVLAFEIDVRSARLFG